MPDWIDYVLDEDAVMAGPHEYLRISWTDLFRREGRCRACFLAEDHHNPVTTAWHPARPYGDNSPAWNSAQMTTYRLVTRQRANKERERNTA